MINKFNNWFNGTIFIEFPSLKTMVFMLVFMIDFSHIFNHTRHWTKMVLIKMVQSFLTQIVLIEMVQLLIDLKELFKK